MKLNIFKFDYIQDFTGVEDTKLRRTIREIYVEIPFGSFNLMKLYEEKDLIKEYYRTEIKKIINNHDKKIIELIENIKNKYKLSSNVEIEDLGKTLQNFVSDYNKIIKKEKEYLEDNYREEKKYDDNLFNEDKQEELKRKFKADIKRIEEKDELFKEEIVNFFEEEKRLSIKTDKDSQVFKDEEKDELEPLLKEIKEAEEQEQEQHNKRIMSITRQFKDSIENLEITSNKNIKELNITMIETFEYHDTTTKTSTKIYNNFDDFEKALGMVVSKIDKSETTIKNKNLKQQTEKIFKDKLNLAEQKAIKEETDFTTKTFFKFTNTVKNIQEKISLIKEKILGILEIKKENVKSTQTINRYYRDFIDRRNGITLEMKVNAGLRKQEEEEQRAKREEAKRNEPIKEKRKSFLEMIKETFEEEKEKETIKEKVEIKKETIKEKVEIKKEPIKEEIKEEKEPIKEEIKEEKEPIKKETMINKILNFFKIK
jgi:hypothetical protein